jgi:hypothetical protein
MAQAGDARMGPAIEGIELCNEDAGACLVAALPSKSGRCQDVDMADAWELVPGARQHQPSSPP